MTDPHELRRRIAAQLLRDLMEVRELSGGDVLVREGDTDHALHLLVHGNLDVSKAGAGGEDIHLHTMQQGELAGAMGFVDGIPRSATLRAKSQTLVYSLQREAFERLAAVPLTMGHADDCRP